MSPGGGDQAKFWAKLEEWGEEEVRIFLATGRMGGGHKHQLAEEWLRQKDQERADAVEREQIEIARDAASSARAAADSARDSVREARRANKIATAAIIMAIVSIIITAIGLYVQSV